MGSKAPTSHGPTPLFGKTCQTLLTLLFTAPDAPRLQEELIQRAALGRGAVQRELERLTAAGLLVVTRTGNRKHYQANRSSPIFSEVEAIVLKTMRPAVGLPGAGKAVHESHQTPAQYIASNVKPIPDVPKRRLAAFCRRHHIRQLGMFGSAARGEANDASDVDLLVEFRHDTQTSLFDMVRIQDELGRLFGRKVDLATAAILENPYRRRAVLKDLRVLYDA